MRSWQAVLAVLMGVSAAGARAQVASFDGHSSTVSIDFFGARSSVFFGFGVQVHPRRVFAPPPVIVAPPTVYVPPPVVMAPPPVYAAPPVVMAPPLVAAPPPVIVVPPSTVVAAPAPQVVAPAVKPVPVEAPALIGLKYLPGVSGVFTSSPGAVGVQGIQFVHSGGLEARLSRWFALRSDAELRPTSRSWDVLGAKVWLAGGDWKVKPFLSASLSGTETQARPGALAIGVVGAGGVDVFFGRHFFLTAEVRYRALPGSCCTEVPQVTGAAGAGLAFF